MQVFWGLFRNGLMVLITVLTLVFGAILGVKVYKGFFALPAEVDVPVLVGKDRDSAQQLLEKLGLKMEVKESSFQPKVPANVIVKQDPPAQRKVRLGREVAVVVSMGPETIVVPDVTGSPLREASLLLENEKLAAGKITRKPKEGSTAEEVLEEKPEAGTKVKKGTKIDLVVTQGGKAAVSVPNYEGLQWAEVRDRMQADGLKVGNVTWVINPKSPAGEILRQNPGPKTAMAAGSGVDLQISGGQDPQNFELHQTLFEYIVPAGSQAQQIKVEVNDATGTNTIYQSHHSPGQKIELEITSLGPDGEFLLYSDDRLIKREKL